MPAEPGAGDLVTPHRPARPIGRWRTWALLASMVANLFLGGVLLGRTLPPAPAPAPAPAARGPENGRMGAGMAARARALPPVDRLKFAAVFARRREEISAARAELRLKGDLAHEAMTATPYDRAKTEAAFADVRAASTRLQAAMQAGVAEGMAELSPQARAQLAARSEQR